MGCKLLVRAAVDTICTQQLVSQGSIWNLLIARAYVEFPWALRWNVLTVLLKKWNEWLTTRPFSLNRGTVAHKIMQKYGFREGQGLGKHEQGLSTALSVEKTSKRGGKIIVGDAADKGNSIPFCGKWEAVHLNSCFLLRNRQVRDPAQWWLFLFSLPYIFVHNVD